MISVNGIVCMVSVLMLSFFAICVFCSVVCCLLFVVCCLLSDICMAFPIVSTTATTAAALVSGRSLRLRLVVLAFTTGGSCVSSIIRCSKSLPSVMLDCSCWG